MFFLKTRDRVSIFVAEVFHVPLFLCLRLFFLWADRATEAMWVLERERGQAALCKSAGDFGRREQRAEGRRSCDGEKLFLPIFFQSFCHFFFLSFGFPSVFRSFVYFVFRSYFLSFFDSSSVFFALLVSFEILAFFPFFFFFFRLCSPVFRRFF